MLEWSVLLLKCAKGAYRHGPWGNDRSCGWAMKVRFGADMGHRNMHDQHAKPVMPQGVMWSEVVMR